MKKFEYKVICIKPEGGLIKTINMAPQAMEKQFNDLGNEGWELVNAIYVTTKLQFYFKREIKG